MTEEKNDKQDKKAVAKMPRQPSVRQILEKMLALGLVTIHLDTTYRGVDVPAQFNGQVHLLLNLSYRFAQAKVTLNRQNVTAALTFGGERYLCTIPYRAIYICHSAVSGEMIFFPKNMPPQILAGLAEKLHPVPELRLVSDENRPVTKQPAPKKIRKAKPKLQVINGGIK